MIEQRRVQILPRGEIGHCFNKRVEVAFPMRLRALEVGLELRGSEYNAILALRTHSLAIGISQHRLDRPESLDLTGVAVFDGLQRHCIRLDNLDVKR